MRARAANWHTHRFTFFQAAVCAGHVLMWKASATHALQCQYATVFSSDFLLARSGVRLMVFTCPTGYGFHLPDRSFYLPRAVGQPLVSVPGG